MTLAKPHKSSWQPKTTILSTMHEVRRCVFVRESREIKNRVCCPWQNAGRKIQQRIKILPVVNTTTSSGWKERSDCVPTVDVAVVEIAIASSSASASSASTPALAPRWAPPPRDGDLVAEAIARARARCADRGVNPSCRSNAPGVNSTGIRLASSSIDHRMLIPPSGPMADLRAHTHTHTCAHTHTHTHMRTRAHTHTHTHTQKEREETDSLVRNVREWK
jgi:hypothetical protein